LNRVFATLIFLSVFNITTVGQDTVVYLYPRLSVSYIKSGFSDTRDLLLAPSRLKSRQWIGFGTLVTSGILLYTQDGAIRNFSQAHTSDFADKLTRYGLEPWGSGKYSIPFLGGLYLVGRLKGDTRLSATTLTACKSAAITSLYIAVAKQFMHRHRPYQDVVPDPSNWDGPIGKFKFASFPSGHSAMVFSIASVFASEYSNTVWVPVIAYSIAAGTALSRIYENDHWATDVLIGSAFGWATGRFLWKKNRTFKVIPSFSQDISVLNFSMVIQ
jgi:membrane-associated phospholipid phosphatase